MNEMINQRAAHLIVSLPHVKSIRLCLRAAFWSSLLKYVPVTCVNAMRWKVMRNMRSCSLMHESTFWQPKCLKSNHATGPSNIVLNSLWSQVARSNFAQAWRERMDSGRHLKRKANKSRGQQGGTHLQKAACLAPERWTGCCRDRTHR